MTSHLKVLGCRGFCWPEEERASEAARGVAWKADAGLVGRSVVEGGKCGLVLKRTGPDTKKSPGRKPGTEQEARTGTGNRNRKPEVGSRGPSGSGVDPLGRSLLPVGGLVQGVVNTVGTRLVPMTCKLVVIMAFNW